MAMQPPPKKPVTPIAADRTKPDEKAIEAIINRGGSTTANVAKPEAAETIAQFNYKIQPYLKKGMDLVREARPRKATKKRPISIQDWLDEAVEEKIEREKKAYKLG